MIRFYSGKDQAIAIEYDVDETRSKFAIYSAEDYPDFDSKTGEYIKATRFSFIDDYGNPVEDMADASMIANGNILKSTSGFNYAIVFKPNTMFFRNDLWGLLDAIDVGLQEVYNELMTERADALDKNGGFVQHDENEMTPYTK